jgi:Uncharacterized protein conserved in bacteria (DUF2188)
MNRYFLGFEGDRWKLWRQGAERAIRTFETKQAAVDFSTDHVSEHSGSLVIKTKENVFQEERTYPRDQDPKASRG